MENQEALLTELVIRHGLKEVVESLADACHLLGGNAAKQGDAVACARLWQVSSDLHAIIRKTLGGH